MAKKQQTGNARTSLESVNDSLSSFEQKLENNQKYIYWTLGIVVAIVAVVLVYVYAIRKPGIEDAKNLMGKADIVCLMQNNPDSAAALYKRAFDNSSYLPANRGAQIYAVEMYKKGKYDEAIKYLEKSTAHGNIAGPAVKSLLADCYVNKKQYDKALSIYDEAAKMAGDNESFTPLFMLKKATVLHALKKYRDEIVLLKDIKSKYPQYYLSNNMNIDKYIERAKALNGDE